MIKTEQLQWTKENGWDGKSAALAQTAQLVLIFGSTPHFRDEDLLSEVKEFYPAAHLLGCSTAGEIIGTEVHDETLVITAVEFEHTEIKSVHATLSDEVDSSKAGELLAEGLISGEHR